MANDVSLNFLTSPDTNPLFIKQYANTPKTGEQPVLYWGIFYYTPFGKIIKRSLELNYTHINFLRYEEYFSGRR